MIKTLGEINKKSKSGIYLILNVETDKFYIGSSKNMSHRWIEHKSNLNRDCHVNKKLQNSWNKKSERFKAFVIEHCESDELLEREQHYLDTYKPYDREVGYNLDKNACGGDFYSLLSDGEKQEFIKKCVRRGEDNGMYGKTHSQKTIKNQKVKAKGRYTLNWFIDKYGNTDGKIKYEERRKKLSKRDMEYCRDNKLTGVKRGSYSEEHKKKISESKLKIKTLEPDIKTAILSRKYTIKEMEEMFGVSKPTILNRKRRYLK